MNVSHINFLRAIQIYERFVQITWIFICWEKKQTAKKTKH